jgi:DNA-binding NarL/FixJ family response regulator
MEIRILLADRHVMFRETVRALLQKEADFKVAADTDDGEQLLQFIATHKPDIILMDTRLSKLSGLEVLRDITHKQLVVRTLLLTDKISQSEIAQALLWGARGIVRKDTTTPLLFKSIRAVVNDQYWISHSDVAGLVKDLRQLTNQLEQIIQIQKRSLSHQQLQIMEAIMLGSTNRDIGQSLAISEHTVKYHLTRIFSKLGVSGRLELARFCLKNRLMDEQKPRLP